MGGDQVIIIKIAEFAERMGPTESLLSTWIASSQDLNDICTQSFIFGNFTLPVHAASAADEYEGPAFPSK